MSKKVNNMLAKAKTQLILHNPFFAQIIMSTRFKVTDSVKTMATDGKWILVNPEFTAKLSNAEVIGVMVHEAMHILGMHHTRIKGRDHNKWNIAADYAINDLIINEGFELPEGGLIDSQYAGMSAEEVYAKLPNDDQEHDAPGGVVMVGSFGPDGNGQGDGDQQSQDDGSNQPQVTPEQIQAEEQRVKEMASAAATAAKMAGKLPGGMERLVDELLETHTPWEDMLRKYMTRPASHDYSWSKPSRRFIGAGMYMPSSYSDDGMGPVVIGVDMSGSIGQRELSMFISEVKQIVEDARPSSVDVVYFDSKVSHVDHFDEPSAMDISMKMHGGGGTDFRPVFDWVAANNVEADVVVMLTDLYGPAPSREEYDTVWACLPGSSDHTPFGERVELTFKD